MAELAPLPFRLGGYGCVVADPPWYYADQANRMRLGYPSMTLDEITRMPVASLAAEAAHLYLWVTAAYLESAWDVSRAWGFEPGPLVVWVKRRVLDFSLGAHLRKLSRATQRLFPRSLFHGEWHLRGGLQIGGGHFVRHAVEYCLVGIRGKVRSLPPELRFPNVIEAPARGQDLEHSKKPPELYRIAERVSPGPRLELFARAPRDGWDVWGLESSGVRLKDQVSANPLAGR